MKCPNDKTEMEKGLIDSAVWMSGERSNFLYNMLKVNIWPQKRKIKPVTAWCCPNCGEVKLVVETGK